MEMHEQQKTKKYEPITKESEQEVKQRIADLFPEQSYIYAVLDFAVCFGIYKDNRLSVFLDGQADLVELDWNYLQELRVFDQEKEIFLVPLEERWSGRIRREEQDKEQEKNSGEFVIEECQKLWGKVRNDQKCKKAGWSLLISERGSRIYIPVDEKELITKEEAILVHRYMRIPNLEKDLELVYQNDIRMVDFCPWKEGGRNIGN